MAGQIAQGTTETLAVDGLNGPVSSGWQIWRTSDGFLVDTIVGEATYPSQGPNGWRVDYFYPTEGSDVTTLTITAPREALIADYELRTRVNDADSGITFDPASTTFS